MASNYRDRGRAWREEKEPSHEHRKMKQEEANSYHHIANVARAAGDDWAAKFMTSIARQTERQSIEIYGPSPKQHTVIRRITAKFKGYLDKDGPKRLREERAAKEKAKQEVKHKADTGQKEKLQVLDSLLSKKPDKFIQSIRDQLAKGRSLSEKQLKAVRHNLYKSRMRSEADFFRQASSWRDERWKQ